MRGRPRKPPPPPPTCPYCKAAATFHPTSERFYRVDYGPVWACEPCGAWVGCHKNSRRHAPLGRLANAELRRAKIDAHAAFDPLWQKAVAQGRSKNEARNAGYAWLATQLGIDINRCHIGKMSLEECRAATAICLQHHRRKNQAA